MTTIDLPESNPYLHGPSAPPRVLTRMPRPGGLAVPAAAAAPTGYPSLDVLLAAMRGTSCTNEWDVVTSYAADRLNQVLRAQYDAKKLVEHITIATSGIDPITGDGFPLTVTLSLGAPLLQFIAGESGKCVLTMPVQASTYTIAQKPPQPIPADVYDIVATLPIAAINGDTGKVSQAGDVITFSDGAPHQCHVIMHFKSTVDTTYVIKARDGQTRPTDDILKLYVVPKLESWFSDNVKEIDYALTSLSNQTPQGDVVLQPRSFVFASAGEGGTGVLSLYIQTVGSGNPPGNPHPSFQPGGKEMLPVPAGHTASLIFAHGLIAGGYVKKQLGALGETVTEVPVGNGLQFTIGVDKTVLKDASERSFWGSFSVDKIDISMRSNPLTLTIADNTATVAWQFHQKLEWSQSTTFSTGGSVPWGRTQMDIAMSKSVAVALDDDKVSVSLPVGSSDYVIKTRALSLKWYEYLVGGQKTLPSQLEASNLRLDLPTLSFNLGGLGFFPVTNLFFPGQHVIDIDTSTGVRTPHDLLLTGQIAPASARAPLAARHLLAMSAGAARVGVPPRDTAALVNAVLTQDRTAASFFNAVADNDPAKFDAWLTTNGYAVPENGFADAVAAAHSESSTDIRLWGGIYKVSEPATLAGKELVVSPKTGRVTLDKQDLDITVLAANRIRWTSGGSTYELTFADHYQDDGATLPSTFEGTITTPPAKPDGSPTVVPFKGKQVIYEKPEEWHKHETLEQAALVIGVLSGLLGLFQGGNELRKYLKKRAAARQVQKDRDQLGEIELDDVKQAQPDEDLWQSVSEDWKETLERRVNETLDDRREGYKDASIDDITSDLKVRLRAELEQQLGESVWAAMKPQLETSLGAMRWFVDVDQARESVISRVVKPKVATLFGADGYVEAAQRSLAAGFKKEVLRESAKEARSKVSALAQTRTETQDELEQVKRELLTQEERAKNQSLTEEEREQAAKRALELEQEVETKTRQVETLEEQISQGEEEARQRQTESEEAERTEEKSRREAEKRGAVDFGVGGE